MHNFFLNPRCFDSHTLVLSTAKPRVADPAVATTGCGGDHSCGKEQDTLIKLDCIAAFLEAKTPFKSTMLKLYHKSSFGLVLSRNCSEVTSLRSCADVFV